jgi:hypothetical protein
MVVIRTLIDWLTLADYEAAKARATEEIVARLSRGNIVVQNGWFMDEAALANLSLAGDLAISRLQSLVPAPKVDDRVSTTA